MNLHLRCAVAAARRVQQISEQSVGDGGEMACEGGWSRERGRCLLGGEESGVITVVLIGFGRLEMTDEIVTMNFRCWHRDQDSIQGFRAGQG